MQLGKRWVAQRCEKTTDSLLRAVIVIIDEKLESVDSSYYFGRPKTSVKERWSSRANV